ncbi:hypothetical protein VT03_27340 [Planctomyces sp. SH-PL14]|nr:hypothetical protein VT03_27340 [Planctomyces sp. SH-PL14]
MEVCRELQSAFSLPAFTFDSENHWEYGYSKNPEMGINVTKTEDSRTIETWIAGCPPRVNFQVILTASEEPPNFQSQLAKILGTTVVRYA